MPRRREHANSLLPPPKSHSQTPLMFLRTTKTPKARMTPRSLPANVRCLLPLHLRRSHPCMSAAGKRKSEDSEEKRNANAGVVESPAKKPKKGSGGDSKATASEEDLNKDWVTVKGSKWALAYIQFFIIPTLDKSLKVCRRSHMIDADLFAIDRSDSCSNNGRESRTCCGPSFSCGFALVASQSGRTSTRCVSATVESSYCF